MVRRRSCFTLLTLLAACSSSTSMPDVRPADRALAERGTDAARPDARRDLAPDGPRPPARWETVAGASLTLTDHSMTTLASGDVLIVGGASSSGTSLTYQKKAYRYLLAQGTLVEAGALAVERARHRAVLLGDGRVLVLGGANASEDYLAATELFDPSKPAAMAWSAGPPMLEALADFDAIRLASGEVMVSGGRRDSFDSVTTVTFFQPATGSWKVTFAALGSKRRLHASVLLKNGKVLVSGGSQGPTKLGSATFLASLEAYDPATGSFKPLAVKMSKERVGHVMRPVSGARVAILGGYCNGTACTTSSTYDLYDPATDTVTPFAHPGFYAHVIAAVSLVDGRVLVLGNNVSEKGVWILNPEGSAGIWEPVPAMATPRAWAESALLGDGSVLVAGGLTDNGGAHVDTLERFIP